MRSANLVRYYPVRNAHPNVIRGRRGVRHRGWSWAISERSGSTTSFVRQPRAPFRRLATLRRTPRPAASTGQPPAPWRGGTPASQRRGLPARGWTSSALERGVQRLPGPGGREDFDIWYAVGPQAAAVPLNFVVQPSTIPRTATNFQIDCFPTTAPRSRGAFFSLWLRLESGDCVRLVSLPARGV